jgi:predicted component of type VI protein secretion system
MSQAVEQEPDQQKEQQAKQQKELAVQRGIRQVEDSLVQWIEKALKEGKYTKTGDKKLEESQFRNLLRVAETTESPEVIKNFLRYQVGREEKWGRGKDSLAERIVHDIDHALRTQAEAIQTETNYESLHEIWIKLIRLYLGYGARRLKYLNFEAENQESERQQDKAKR